MKSRRSGRPRRGVGRAPWLGRATAMTLSVLALLAAAPVSADTVADLLFELGFVPLDGRPPPAFTLAGLDGRPVSLAQLRGRVVLLYFWATW
jgi:cytochrome oxidase Cu insertion factor (SCO1/SenC/PrrC family)